MLHARARLIRALVGRESRLREYCMVVTEKSVKLKGVLKSTASSVEIKIDGRLVAELYDFNNEAEKRLGNDVAFLP